MVITTGGSPSARVTKGVIKSRSAIRKSISKGKSKSTYIGGTSSGSKQELEMKAELPIGLTREVEERVLEPTKELRSGVTVTRTKAPITSTRTSITKISQLPTRTFTKTTAIRTTSDKDSGVKPVTITSEKPVTVTRSTISQPSAIRRTEKPDEIKVSRIARPTGEVTEFSKKQRVDLDPKSKEGARALERQLTTSGLSTTPTEFERKREELIILEKELRPISQVDPFFEKAKDFRARGETLARERGTGKTQLAIARFLEDPFTTIGTAGVITTGIIAGSVVAPALPTLLGGHFLGTTGGRLISAQKGTRLDILGEIAVESAPYIAIGGVFGVGKAIQRKSNLLSFEKLVKSAQDPSRKFISEPSYGLLPDLSKRIQTPTGLVIESVKLKKPRAGFSVNEFGYGERQLTLTGKEVPDIVRTKEFFSPQLRGQEPIKPKLADRTIKFSTVGSSKPDVITAEQVLKLSESRARLLGKTKVKRSEPFLSAEQSIGRARTKVTKQPQRRLSEFFLNFEEGVRFEKAKQSFKTQGKLDILPFKGKKGQFSTDLIGERQLLERLKPSAKIRRKGMLKEAIEIGEGIFERSRQPTRLVSIPLINTSIKQKQLLKEKTLLDTGIETISKQKPEDIIKLSETPIDKTIPKEKVITSPSQKQDQSFSLPSPIPPFPSGTGRPKKKKPKEEIIEEISEPSTLPLTLGLRKSKIRKERRRDILEITGKFTELYTPSVEAIIFEKKGKRPSKELIKTGLVLRPL